MGLYQVRSNSILSLYHPHTILIKIWSCTSFGITKIRFIDYFLEKFKQFLKDLSYGDLTVVEK